MARRSRKAQHTLAMVTAVLLVVTLAAVGVLFVIQGSNLPINSSSSLEPSQPSESEPDLPPTEESSREEVSSQAKEAEDVPTMAVPDLGADKPEKMLAAYLIPGKDFLLDPDNETAEDLMEQIDGLMEDALALGLNSLIVDLRYDEKMIYNSAHFDSIAEFDCLKYITEQADENDLYVYLQYEAKKAPSGGEALTLAQVGASGLNQIEAQVRELVENYDFGGLIITDYDTPEDEVPYWTYLAAQSGVGYNNYLYLSSEAVVRTAALAAKEADKKLNVGLLVAPVWANEESHEEGSDTQAEYEQYWDGHADTVKYLDGGYLDYVIVDNHGTTGDSEIPFEAVTQWWCAIADRNSIPLYMLHASDQVGSGGEWSDSGQLAMQVLAAKKYTTYQGSAFASLTGLAGDTTGSTRTLLGALEGTVTETHVSTKLQITNLSHYEFATQEPVIYIRGSSDPNQALTVNGETVEQDGNGYFVYAARLDVGLNTFEFEHKGDTITLKITKTVQVLGEVAPQGAITVEGGSKLTVTATAYDGATVTATLGGQSVTLTKDTAVDESEDKDSQYAKYSGEIMIPAATDAVQSLGSVSFSASWNGQTESATGSSVSINRKPKLAAEGQLVQINTSAAETFPTAEINDLSNPGYFPLPKGAIDRAVSDKITYSDGSKTYEYYNLASGNRVYASDITVLSDTGLYENTVQGLSVKNDGKYTYVMIGNAWKVSYKMSVSGGMVSIALNDTGSVCDSMPSLTMNPLFSSATWSGTTLQLKLKSGGNSVPGVYPYYSDNTLVLRFNNPVAASGATVVIDPGHSDSDPGAPGYYPGLDERELNRAVANLVVSKLKAQGVNAILAPTGSGATLRSRVDYAASNNADLFVSIHHNSNPNPEATGTEVYYFNNQSKALAAAMASAISGSASTTNRGGKFSYYYVTRNQSFPAVLAECGFVSSQIEYNRLIESSTQDRVADGIVSAVIGYLNGNYVSSATGTEQVGTSSGASTNTNTDTNTSTDTSASSASPGSSGNSSSSSSSIISESEDGWYYPPVEEYKGSSSASSSSSSQQDSFSKADVYVY